LHPHFFASKIFEGSIFINLKNVDYLIGAKCEFIIGDLIEAHFKNKLALQDISGILYKENGIFKKTNFDKWCDDIDNIPYPDRNLMNNKLYIRPDTKEIQATITTSRGCPSNCIFCLTPKISGKKLRLRSPKSVLDEIYDCYKNHNIKNFFFKSDTFTYDKNWTIELCSLIIKLWKNIPIKSAYYFFFFRIYHFGNDCKNFNIAKSL